MTDILLGYDDSEGCNLRGFYDPDIHTTIPHKTINIDDRQRLLIMKNKLLWRVEGGRLIKLKDGNFKRKSKPVDKVFTLMYEGNEYRLDSNLRETVPLNLAICSHDTGHMCKIWCTNEGALQFKEHSKAELLGLARSINVIREQHSIKMYGDIT